MRFLAALTRHCLTAIGSHRIGKDGPQRLHLGCGNDIRQSWINLEPMRVEFEHATADPR